MESKYLVVFQTEAGWMGIVGSSNGICRTTLPEESYQNALKAVNPNNKYIAGGSDCFTGLITDFINYFRGLRVNFKVQIDFSQVTGFQKAVYQTAISIPYGETHSYSWIAHKIGNPQAARAVGQALKRNPLPILVPCHRVIQTSGGLGGFAGGITLKSYLLKLESTNTD
jgi:methylated-DNA-[protein]-cysteine S-methyltransferase